MNKRPPIPHDISSAPRHKTRKKQQGTTGLKSALQAVSALSRSDPTEQDFQDYSRETNAEKNDRGAAILLATNLENALLSAIVNKLSITEGGRKELFGQ